MYATNCSPKWCKLSRAGVQLSGNLRSTFTFLTILEGNFKPSHFCSISFRRVIYILAICQVSQCCLYNPTKPHCPELFQARVHFPLRKTAKIFQSITAQKKSRAANQCSYKQKPIVWVNWSPIMDSTDIETGQHLDVTYFGSICSLAIQSNYHQDGRI